MGSGWVVSAYPTLGAIDSGGAGAGATGSDGEGGGSAGSVIARVVVPVLALAAVVEQVPPIAALV
ncbi:MAG: hypothetical protein M3120_04000 [Pseudomonadota bacterium]|nr:hypothetical protein [Pseudomonadota bacterium]